MGVGVCLTLKPDEIATGVTVNKNHPFWVKTHFRYFKSWIGAIILLFYHSFVFSVEKVRRLEKKYATVVVPVVTDEGDGLANLAEQYSVMVYI